MPPNLPLDAKLMPKSKSSQVRTDNPRYIFEVQYQNSRPRITSSVSQRSIVEHHRVHNTLHGNKRPRTEPSRSPNISPFGPPLRLIRSTSNASEASEHSLRAHKLHYPHSILDFRPHTLFAIEPWLESLFTSSQSQPSSSRRQQNLLKWADQNAPAAAMSASAKRPPKKHNE